MATNTAGRGTDITLSPHSRVNGGLHVIYAFYLESFRVEMQGIGRAARQGEPGSCSLILKMDPIPGEPLSLSQETYLQQLHLVREQTSKIRMSQRKLNSRFEEIRNDYLEQFYADLARWNDQLNLKFFIEIANKWGLLSKIKKSSIIAPLENMTCFLDLYKSCRNQLAKDKGGAKRNWIEFCQMLKEHISRENTYAWAKKFYNKIADLENGHRSFTGDLDLFIENEKKVIEIFYLAHWKEYRENNLASPKHTFTSSLRLLECEISRK